jgi:hypothetical protein
MKKLFIVGVCIMVACSHSKKTTGYKKQRSLERQRKDYVRTQSKHVIILKDK